MKSFAKGTDNQVWIDGMNEIWSATLSVAESITNEMRVKKKIFGKANILGFVCFKIMPRESSHSALDWYSNVCFASKASSWLNTEHKWDIMIGDKTSTVDFA